MRLWDPAVPVDSLRERHPRECCTVYVAMVTELSWDRREEKMVRRVHQIQMSLQVNAHHSKWALTLWHAGLSATALRDDIHVGRMEERLKTSVCQQLSLHGGLSDMNEVSLQYTALQVSVRQESAKASLILQIEPTSRQWAQLCLRTRCGWGGELLQPCEWSERSVKDWEQQRSGDGAGTIFVRGHEVSRKWFNYRTAKGTNCHI